MDCPALFAIGMRLMKPFGVRLAAGAVTILLGAIMAGQAQKNRQNESDSSWQVPTNEIGGPPAPIAALDGESWLSSPDIKSAGSTDPFPESGDAVQLVQHTEPVNEDSPNSLSVEMPSLEVPGVELPTFQEPTDAVAFKEAPAATLQLPSDADSSPQDDGPAISMSFPSGDLPSAPTVPAITMGDPSVVLTDSNDTSAPPSEQPLLGDQPGNVLRGGDRSGLRPETAAETAPDAALRPGQAPERIADDAPPMLRAITVPDLAESHENSPAIAPQAGLPGPGAPNAGKGMAAQYDGPPQSNQVPAVRIVSQPHGGLMQSGDAAMQLGGAPVQPGVPQLRLGPQSSGMQDIGGRQNFGGMQPNSFADTSFNQPASNQGPPQRQPVAPPLGNQPSARIASLPTPNMIRSPGYQPQSFEQPSSAGPLGIDPAATMASPGDRRFDGVQSPSVVIHKRAPAEVKVGKPATFVIHVQNVGAVEAMDVRVSDRVPSGMQLVDASPSPVQQGEVLTWQLGSMKAGDERTVTLQLVPMEEGELGSVARVTFEAAASVRTISTRPELQIVQRANEKVLIGQQLEIDLEFSNPGTGEATGVVIQEDVPEGLEHPKGRKLDNSIGTLQPGETRRQVLRLRAVAPGIIQNTIHLKGDDGLEASHTVSVEVVAPELQVRLQGPSRRFLERQATYELDIANSGTADATNVEVAAYLDRGFTFVSTDFEGQYDSSRHAVFWSLASLPAGDQGKVPLTLLPVREGERTIRLEARADLGVVAKSEQTVTVDSLAELTFQITDSADPIEVGGETMYEIRLTNSGSRNDSNVRVQLQLPQGVELLSSDADADTDGRGLVAFAPRNELAAGTDVVYRVKARGVAPGTHLIKAVVLSDQSTVPVTKEESTMVYADR